MITLKPYIICSVLLLQQLNLTRDWSGTDLPGHSFAKFEHFDGTQKFDIKLDKKDSFIFNYKAAVKKGTLRLEVKSSTKTVLSKDIKESEEGTLKILNPKGEKYKFILTGKDAQGNYDVTYKKL